MIGNRNFGDSVRRARLSIVVILAGIVWALCLPDMANAQGGFDGPGHYEIVNLNSGKALDMDRNDQMSVIQFSSQGTDNQVWEIRPSRDPGFYYLRNAMNGNALEADGNRNSSRVRAARFDGGVNQQWRFDTGNDGNALIISRLGKTLDIPNGTSQDGVPVQIYDINGDANQRFIFRRVSGRWASGRPEGDFGDERRHEYGGGAWGTIAATPNPCRIERRRADCTTFITWSTRGVTLARVYVTDDGPRGRRTREFGSSTACESSRCSAPWISRGKTFEFTLFDFSSGRRGQVLASVIVSGTEDDPR